MADALNRFRVLFQGSDVTHGHSVLRNKVNDKGKHEARSWTEKGEPSDKDWEAHVSGVRCLGVSPIRGDSTVRWGAIDIDEYQGGLEELNKKIQEAGLPLVVCRSKSGGPHLYLFLSEWVPAKLVISKLDEIAGFLGYGTSEIFPKQGTLGTGSTPESGNWINLPYFGGVQYLRYALNQKGTAIKELEEFCNYADDRCLDRSTLEALSLPEQQETFPEGPPCLNRIWQPDNSQDMRNIALSNAAVYWKQADPDNWEKKLEEVNRKLKEPLPAAELRHVARSHKKKDYRYQCSKEPLCRYCNATKCKTLKYGISQGTGMPGLKSLTKMGTEPPIWYLDVADSRGNDHRMNLTTEELQNVRNFQKRAMEAINEMPPLIKNEQWEEMLQGLFRHVTEIEIAPEMKPAGQFDEMLFEFLTTRVSSEANRSYSDVLRGLPYEDDDYHYFRYKDLAKFLRDYGFNTIRENQMMAVIKEKYDGERESVKIEGKTIALWKIRKNEQINEPEFPFPVPEQEKEPF